MVKGLSLAIGKLNAGASVLFENKFLDVESIDDFIAAKLQKMSGMWV